MSDNCKTFDEILKEQKEQYEKEINDLKAEFISDLDSLWSCSKTQDDRLYDAIQNLKEYYS